MVKGRKSSEIPYEKLMAVRKRRAFEVDETRLKRLRKAATNVIQKQLVDLKLKEIEQYKQFEESRKKFEGIRGWPTHLTKLKLELEYFLARRNFLESRLAIVKGYLDLASSYGNIIRFVPEEIKHFQSELKKTLPQALGAVEWRIRRLSSKLEKTAIQWTKN